jgi:hypothetical protein
MKTTTTTGTLTKTNPQCSCRPNSNGKGRRVESVHSPGGQALETNQLHGNR